MKLFLASRLNCYTKDEHGNRAPCIIEDENLILTNIKRSLSRLDNLLVIANDPNDFEINDSRLNLLSKGFEMTGLSFKKKTVLDNRNIKLAKKLIEEADFIFLAGGKILQQIKFFDKIKLTALLKNSNAVIFGASAGAMNLTKEIFNFPECLADIPEPRLVNGLGFADVIIVPHFDGDSKTYQIHCEEVDIVNDYVLPFSKNKRMYGLPDGSYIMVENGVLKFYGAYYEIQNTKVRKLV